MVRLTVFYPHSAGAKFDLDYYLNRHLPMASQLIGSAIKGVTVEEGIAGAEGAPPHYIVMTHVMFESVEALERAMHEHGPKIFADVPNYTTIQPQIQISEVKL